MRAVWYLLIAICDFSLCYIACGMTPQHWDGEVESKGILGEQYHAEYEEIYRSYQDWWSFSSVDTTESGLKERIFVVKRPKKKYRAAFYEDHPSYDDIALSDEEWADDQAIKALKLNLGDQGTWREYFSGQFCYDSWKCISPLP